MFICVQTVIIRAFEILLEELILADTQRISEVIGSFQTPYKMRCFMEFI